MSIAINLPFETEQKLRQLANHSGRSVDHYLADLLNKQAHDAESSLKQGLAQAQDSEHTAALRANRDSDSEDERPWRGVFAPEHEREVIFTQELQLRLRELPEWEPYLALDPRWLEDDQE